jgi:hypothetical protein
VADLYQWPFDAVIEYWFRIGRARKAERLREAEARRQQLEVVQ